MKRKITFGNSVAVVERSRTAAILQVATNHSSELAVMADTMAGHDGITVISILPLRGKVTFVVDKSVSNGEMIDVICDSLSRVYGVDTTVSNARAEDTL